MNPAKLFYATIVLLFFPAVLVLAEEPSSPEKFIKVGFISPLTGPATKYGAHQAAEIAVEEINAAGGIAGAKLKLIMEDGRCDGAATATAVNKLINIDGVKYILGGHCSTESMIIAPIAEKNKVLMLASISATPSLSGFGKYVFRTSPVAIVQSQLYAKHAREKGIQKMAVLYEDTSYVAPIAEELKERFKDYGGEIVYFDSFNPGTTDFRTQILKIKKLNPQALFFGVQAQDTTLLIAKQLSESGINLPLYGNEVVGNSASLLKQQDKNYLNGLIFAEPKFSEEAPRTKAFIAAFEKKFKTTGIPYGMWTSESYDGVMLLAKVINECGTDVENVAACLNKVKDYEGASGVFSINEKHDGVREYILKRLVNGEIKEY